jgi:hypothetical protein
MLNHRRAFFFLMQTAEKLNYQEESVSTGYINFAPQSLPQTPTDRELPKFDARAVAVMRNDSEVHASVEFLVDALFSDNIQFSGAIFEGEKDFEQAEEIKNFISRALLESPQTQFLPVMKELARGAIYNGHKVAEIVLRLEETGTDSGKLVLDKLKVKPTKATAFVVDEFFNVLGLVGVRKGQSVISSGSIAPENVIPTIKFFICTLETEDADPRGVSQIKSAYEPLCDKRETRKQFSIYRKKCSVRSFIATTPASAERIKVYNDDGTPKLVDGVQVTKSANQSTGETLAKLINDTVAVFSEGTVVTPLEADGKGEQFKLSYDISNSDIRKAILLQTMATGEAEKGGLGTGGHQTHERVLGRRVDSFRDVIARQIYNLAKLLVSLNFGADKVHLTPSVSLGNFDKAETKDKLAAAVDAGYTLHESQFDELDGEFNFPRRDLEAAEAEQEEVKKDALSAEVIE